MKGFGKFRQRRKKAEKSPVSGGAKLQDSHDADEVSLVVVWLLIWLLYMYKYISLHSISFLRSAFAQVRE